AYSVRSPRRYDFRDRPQSAPRFRARATRDSSPSRCRACRDKKRTPLQASARCTRRAAGSLRRERGDFSERDMRRGAFWGEFIPSGKKKKGEPLGSPFSLVARCLEHVAPVEVHVEPLAALALVRVGENARLAADAEVVLRRERQVARPV